MAEPKIRFRADDGSEFPAFERLTMNEIFTEIVDKNHPDMTVLSILQGIGTVIRDESDRNIVYDKSNLKGYKAMKKNDFIIHLRSFEGGLECSNHDGISSPAYKILRTDKLVPEAYKAYFRSFDFVERKLAVAVTGIRDGKNIDMPTFWEIPMDIPSIPEQQKIADFFSNLDDVIAASEEEVANLKMQKKAIMQKIFTQEVRFKKEDGSDYPDWDEKKLGDICSKIGSGKTPKGGKEIYTSSGVALIRSQNVLWGQLDLSDVAYISEEINDTMKNSSVRYGDILLNITGASIGRVCVFLEDFVANINQHVCIVRIKDQTMFDQKFILQQLMSDALQNQIWLLQNGGSREGLNFQQIANFIIVVPHIEEQQVIAKFLTTYDEAIVAAKQELEKWKELKKGLLQQMFV